MVDMVEGNGVGEEEEESGLSGLSGLSGRGREREGDTTKLRVWGGARSGEEEESGDEEEEVGRLGGGRRPN